jgi:hypothetical protein
METAALRLMSTLFSCFLSAARNSRGFTTPHMRRMEFACTFGGRPSGDTETAIRDSDCGLNDKMSAVWKLLGQLHNCRNRKDYDYENLVHYRGFTWIRK